MSIVRAEAIDWPRTFGADQLAGTGYGALNPRELRSWLIANGFAQPNGSAETLELTALGAEAAVGVRDLQAWIRS